MPTSLFRRTRLGVPGAIGAVLATLALMMGLGATPAHASADVGLRTTDIYAYAASGESVDFSFSSSQGLQVVAPDGTVAASCASGACSGLVSSADAGVWLLRYTNESDNRINWNVHVEDSLGVEISGRVWAERWNISNTNFIQRNFTATYLSEFGVSYEAEFNSHNGWVFRLVASNRGVMFNDGSCLPAYRSVPGEGSVEPAAGSIAAISGDDYLLDSVECRDQGLVFYRIFWGEDPDPLMPASTPLWADGRADQTWVLPQYQAPEITDLHFDRAGFSAAGNVVGTLSGQSGTVRVLVDTDGNGIFTDAVDIESVYAASTGEFSVPWDGVDGLGDVVPPDRDFTIRAELAGESEIHFVDTDVEGRGGGISVSRQNGPDAPDSRLSWNDGYLPGVRSTTTSPLVGDLVDSTAGAHTWGFSGGNGWGNARIIDDWMFIYPTTAGEADVDGLPVLSVGDLVWYDADQNGLQDVDEPGIPGVTVRVLAADDTVLGTVVTGADGEYTLDALDASAAARVAFDVSTADVTGLTALFGITDPAQLGFTVQNVDGSPTADDSDVDPATGEAALVDLTDGGETTSVDAGLIASASLIVEKAVVGTAPANFEYEITEQCTDFRGAESTETFTVEAGDEVLRAYPAGVECEFTETDAGGATTIAYAVGDATASSEAPVVRLLASTDDPQVLLVTNTFVPPQVPAQALGSTGADVRTPLIVGVLLLIVGAALTSLVLRRKQGARSS